MRYRLFAKETKRKKTVYNLKSEAIEFLKTSYYNMSIQHFESLISA